MKPNEAEERKRMDNSKIHEALMAVQSELKAPKGQMNKFGGYKYRSCEDILEAVKPILKAHSLVLRLSDKPVIVDSWHYIEATATVESQDGATYTVTAYAREPEFKKGMHMMRLHSIFLSSFLLLPPYNPLLLSIYLSISLP